MFKLNDQTKADLAKAWEGTKPVLKKVGAFAAKAGLVLFALASTFVIMCYSVLLSIIWSVLCAASFVFYLNYRDVVWAREQQAKADARAEARRQKMGW